MADTFVYLLELEAIGEDTAIAIRDADRVFRMAFPNTPKSDWRDGLPWVAEIKGFDRRYGLAREFVKCMKDYSQANSKGSRGVMYTYALYPGRIYEVYKRISWRNGRRYFCRVVDGELVEMDRADVDAVLRVEEEISIARHLQAPAGD